MAKLKMPLPTGGEIEGEEVLVDQSNERWSEFTLQDGSLLRMKPVVAAVIRIDGQFDAEGNPVYLVKSTTAISVLKVPETLRRKH
jgi:hypothetical protein